MNRNKLYGIRRGLAALLLALLVCASVPAEAACGRPSVWQRPSLSQRLPVCRWSAVRWGNPDAHPVPDTAPVPDSIPVPDTIPVPDITPVPDTPPVPDTTPVPDAPSDSGIAAYESEVIRLVNAVRAEQGLPALTADAELCRYARVKSRDMRENSYFSHDSPTYGTPFQMMKSFGITYRAAGENIAYGYNTPQAVMEGWMHSEGHRANILNASYTRIGVGYVAEGNYWTQWFIG